MSSIRLQPSYHSVITFIYSSNFSALSRFFTYAFLLLITGINTLTISAQKRETFYDVNWKLCDQSNACYYSVVEKTDSGYLQQDYFMYGLKLQMKALYEDSACKIMNGKAAWYYANGSIYRISNMIHNKKEGVNMEFYYNGLMSDSGTYHDDLPTGVVYKWHTNGFPSDSISNISDSMDVHISWFDDGMPASAGREIRGKNIGTWVYYHHNGKKASIEVFNNNKVVSTKHFDESGTEIAFDTNRVEKAAVFKNGLKDWGTYLARNLTWPTGYRLDNRDKVVMKVNFTLNESGKVEDVFIATPVHPEFDKVAYETISKCPLWKPAVQHNRTVKYKYVQTVTFAQP